MIDNIRTVLALSSLPRVGRATLKNLLEQLKDRAKRKLAFLEVVEELREMIPPFSRTDLDAAVARADELVIRCEALGVSVHPFGWPSYPSQLARLAKPPAILFSVGQFESSRNPRIAVIGTRKPTNWGLKTARACAAEVVEFNGVVVSGLALGIDAAAHAATVHHSGPTWAVLAHGLHTVSPSSNRELAKQIVEKGGALISEYPPGEPAQRHYFVERDRIQAGLCDAVLVIESGINGGSMHTVTFAQDAHVPVWVTFPQTKVHDAETRLDDLPETQQGTWQLLNARKASRVSTIKSLNRMLTNLTRNVAESSSDEEPFTLK
jgi:DNA processing protein